MPFASGSFPSNNLIWFMEKQLTYARIDNWRSEDLFSWQWWLLVAVLIIPWFIWWKCARKDSLLETGLFGLIIMLLSSCLDTMLTELGLWQYNYWIGPLFPCLVCTDFTLIPITYMYIYQNFYNWRSFLIAMLVISAFFSFLGEAFLVWLGIYELHGWKYAYSFPIYAVIGILPRLMVEWLKSRQMKSA